MLGRYLARGLAGQLDPAQARSLLERARAAGIAEAADDLVALAKASATPIAKPA